MQSRGSRHEDVASLSTCFQPRSKKADLCVATDTDVVVIAIASATRFIDCEAWIEFGHGKHKRYIPVHSITAS